MADPAVPLLTAAQLAAHLAVSVRHVERCAAAGMPSIPVGARAKRYEAAACLAWLAEHSDELSRRPLPRAVPAVSREAVRKYQEAARRQNVRVIPSKR